MLPSPHGDICSVECKLTFERNVIGRFQVLNLGSPQCVMKGVHGAADPSPTDYSPAETLELGGTVKSFLNLAILP